MIISKLDFNLALFQARKEAMDAQRAYSAAHFNGAIYDLQHELALAMNEVIDLKRHSKYFLSASYGKTVYVDSDSIEQVSYHVVRIDKTCKFGVAKSPMSADLSAVKAMELCAKLNDNLVSPNIYYAVEVF